MVGPAPNRVSDSPGPAWSLEDQYRHLLSVCAVRPVGRNASRIGRHPRFVLAIPVPPARLALDLRITVKFAGPSFNTSSYETAMHHESTIIERVETIVRHPVFTGSNRAMNLILDDLESLERLGRIGPATYHRLREMILYSPHLAACR
jgi:hypothetical protein